MVRPAATLEEAPPRRQTRRLSLISEELADLPQTRTAVPHTVTLRNLALAGSIRPARGAPNPYVRVTLVNSTDAADVPSNPYAAVTPQLYHQATPTWDEPLEIVVPPDNSSIPELVLRIYDAYTLGEVQPSHTQRGPARPSSSHTLDVDDSATTEADGRLLAWARVDLLKLIENSRPVESGRLSDGRRAIDGQVRVLAKMDLNMLAELPAVSITFQLSLSQLLQLQLRVKRGFGEQQHLLQASADSEHAGGGVRDSARAAAVPPMIVFIGHDLGPKIEISRSLALRSGGSVLSVFKLSLAEILSNSAKGKVLRKIVLEGDIIGSDERIGLLRKAMSHRPPPYLLVDFPQSLQELEMLEREVGAVAHGVRIADGRSHSNITSTLAKVSLALSRGDRLTVVLGSQSVRASTHAVIDALNERGLASLPYEMTLESSYRALADVCIAWLKSARLRAFFSSHTEYSDEKRAELKVRSLERKRSRKQQLRLEAVEKAEVSSIGEPYETALKQVGPVPEMLEGTAMSFLAPVEAQRLRHSMEAALSPPRVAAAAAYVSSHSPLAPAAQRIVYGTRVVHPSQYALDPSQNALDPSETPLRWHHRPRHDSKLSKVASAPLLRRRPSPGLARGVAPSLTLPPVSPVSKTRTAPRGSLHPRILTGPRVSGSSARRPLRAPDNGSPGKVTGVKSPEQDAEDTQKWVETARSLREAIRDAAQEGAPRAAARIAALLQLGDVR